MLAAVLSGATFGLLNMAHCAAMCGPLSSAVSVPAAGQRPIRYQLGRLVSYGFLGAMSGHLGRALRLTVPGGASVWIVAALTAAACLLTARSLLGSPRATSGLVQLQTRPRRRSLFAMFVALAPKEPLVLGLLSALLPCGVLASALLAAAATGEAWSGMFLMFTFAAVSGVAVWAAGMAIQLAPIRFALPSVRRALAVALVALAGFILYRPMRALTLDPHVSVERVACHGSVP